MRISLQFVYALTLVLLVADCGPKSKTTHGDSRKFASLAEKKEFLERYVTFRRSYDALDFIIDYRDGGDGGIPSPTEWNVRLVATVPPNEIDQWTSGLRITTEPDKNWVTTVPNAPSDLMGFEWHSDSTRTVGIDRERHVVVYRNRTQ